MLGACELLSEGHGALCLWPFIRVGRQRTGAYGTARVRPAYKDWPWQVVGRDSGASDDGIGRGSPGSVGRTESRLCKNFFK